MFYKQNGIVAGILLLILFAGAIGLVSVQMDKTVNRMHYSVVILEKICIKQYFFCIKVKNMLNSGSLVYVFVSKCISFQSKCVRSMKKESSIFAM